MASPVQKLHISSVAGPALVGQGKHLGRFNPLPNLRRCLRRSTAVSAWALWVPLTSSVGPAEVGVLASFLLPPQGDLAGSA